MDRSRVGPEHNHPLAVPRTHRRAAGPDRGLHPRRDSDLDAVTNAVTNAVTHAVTDAVTDADAVTHANADSDAETVTDPQANAEPHANCDADRFVADPDTNARFGAGSLELRDRRAVAALIATAAAHTSDLWMLSQYFTHRTPQGPGPNAVHDDDVVESGEERIVEVGVQALEGGLDPFAMQIQCRRHAFGRAAAHLLCLDIAWGRAGDRLMHDVEVIGGDDQPGPIGLQRDPTRAAADLHDPAGAAQRA